MIWLPVGDAPPELTPRDLDVPETVLAIGAVGDHAHELSAVELDYLDGAVESRRREFSTGRMLARQALSRLGAPVGPLLRRPDRAPIWPDDICGSISHCRHWAVALASRSVRSAGVDIECRERVSSRTHDSLFTPVELARAVAAGVEPTVLFSAKEAIFKAVHQITREQIEFLEAEVRLDVAAQRFRARYLGTSRRSRIMEQVRGVVCLTPDHVLTLALL
ncbi:MAG TPA: 4'-phosphopantetheinyl transferase superfamily protein [Caulobacteraceae bacterium]